MVFPAIELEAEHAIARRQQRDVEAERTMGSLRWVLRANLKPRVGVLLRALQEQLLKGTLRPIRLTLLRPAQPRPFLTLRCPRP